MPQSPDFFFDYVEEGVQEAQMELLDYGIIIERFYTQFMDAGQQMEVLSQLDKSCYQGLVLPAASERLAPCLNEFVKAGIPVVTFDSDAAESDRFFFIGEDPMKSGRLCGRLMGKFLCGRGRVVVLSNDSGPSFSRRRIQGFGDVLRCEFPEIEVVEFAEYYGRVEVAYHLAEKIMEGSDPVNGIFCNSASGTVGVGRFFAQAQDLQKPVLIGYGITHEVKGFLEKGIYDVVVDQNPRKQSYFAIIFLGKYLTEDWRPESEWLEIRTKLVLADNADDYGDEQDKTRHILL